MVDKINKDELFNILKSEYITTRNNVGFHLLKLTLIVLEANKKLSKKTWSKWLRDPDINLKHTQAKKLITIAQKCNNNGQLTDLLNKAGIEKTYLICQIENEQKRSEIAEQIIDVPFTVKQTKEVINKVEKENIPAKKAIEIVKVQPKETKNKSVKNTVPIEDYEKLKTDNNAVLLEKQKLEKLVKQLQADNNTILTEKQKLEELVKQLQADINCQCNQKDSEPKPKKEKIPKSTEFKPDNLRLKEPIKTDLEDEIVNIERHSITYKGYELPLPEGYKDIAKFTTQTLIFAATNSAKNMFGLDL